MPQDHANIHQKRVCAISLKNTLSTPLKGRHREVVLGTNFAGLFPRTNSWPLVKTEFRFFCFSVIFFSVTTGPQENGQFVQLTGQLISPKAIIHSKKVTRGCPIRFDTQSKDFTPHCAVDLITF